MTKRKRVKVDASNQQIKTWDRVEVVDAYGSQKGMTGVVEQICDMTGFIHVRSDRHKDDPAYRNFLFGPYSTRQLKKIDKGRVRLSPNQK